MVGVPRTSMLPASPSSIAESLPGPRNGPAPVHGRPLLLGVLGPTYGAPSPVHARRSSMDDADDALWLDMLEAQRSCVRACWCSDTELPCGLRSGTSPLGFSGLPPTTAPLRRAGAACCACSERAAA